MSSPPTSSFKGRTGIDRVLHAFDNSRAGLKAAFTGEAAFRQEMALALVLVPAAFWVGRGWVETALLLATVLLVLVVELLNSGLEAVVDRVSLERHELAKRAKDLGSAAVFVALLLCGVVWTMALWHRLAGAGA